MTVLAQQPVERLTIPDVSWVTIAPEIVVAVGALVLLMLAVGGTARTLIAAPSAVAVAGVGVWLIVGGTLLPGAALVGLGLAIIAVTVGFEDRPQLIQTWLGAAVLAAALVLVGWQWAGPYREAGAQAAFSGSVALDGVALFTSVVVLVTGLLALPMGYGYLRDRGIYRPEFEPLLLVSITGMMVLAGAADLLIVFLGIEVLTFPLFVMIGMARRDRRAQEASLKYFLLGAVASAVMLFGIALVYIATGSIALSEVAAGVAFVGAPVPLILLGVAMITVGLGFKAAMVPFHLWTPDVYQGSPTNVTAFMAAAVKAAAFAALLRVYFVAFGRLDSSWVPVLAGAAAVTMLLGAVAAIVQRDVKRVLAYSSIAHVGYALVGVTSNSIDGVSSTLFYLLTYAVSAMAAFGCVVAIERLRRGEVALIDLKGLGRRAPVLSVIFGVSLLSLAGIPATAGFTGKFAVFRAGVEAGLTWLVVVGVVSSVIAAFFYLRLMAAMFLEEPDEGAGLPVVTSGLSAAIALSFTAILWLGILPDTFVALAQQAADIAR